MHMTAAHISQDDTGTWWYAPPSARGKRTRCRVDRCAACGEEFVRTPMHRGPACSRVCGRLLIRYLTKPCARCGRNFSPRSANHRYCSDACKRHVTTCEGCGGKFSPGKSARGRFCSTECYYESIVPTGTRRVDSSVGYVRIKVPRGTPGRTWGGNQKRWMLEHRFVMQQVLGRPLEPWERVHHRDGDRTNNAPENLELWKRAHPSGVRHGDYHCPGCQCPME